ncbi:MAG TPA: sarcosine oxidase subunit beta family protein [Aliiroseovarius sp.]|nr:sarcosine oxidase subunit beta family protein [Aliiroseovarius sp.]
MRPRYSGLALFKHGLFGRARWPRAWGAEAPQDAYDVIIVGGGGHGLATAYYLAKKHRIRRVAVLEKGWIGGGNTGRNTTVIRSNYFYPESNHIYGLSHRLYRSLSRKLNFNIMYSPRGMVQLIHSEAEMELAARAVNAMVLGGSDAELWTRDEVARRLPLVNQAPDARFPVYGAAVQPSAATARHDAVAWGYARAASALGVDIIQNCEVTDFLTEAGRVTGVATNRGEIRAGRVGLAVAGHSSHLAARAGLDLPITSYALQAFVTEPVKPILDTILFSARLGVYISQSDRGGLVFGGGLDRVPSYAQRGNLPVAEGVVAGITNMLPALATARILRQWAGIVDVTPDSSPIIGPSGVAGLYLNCGWGTGGFKAIPGGGWVFAHLLAKGEHPEQSRPFDLSRFERGRLIDEGAAAGIAH